MILLFFCLKTKMPHFTTGHFQIDIYKKDYQFFVCKYNIICKSKQRFERELENHPHGYKNLQLRFVRIRPLSENLLLRICWLGNCREYQRLFLRCENLYLSGCENIPIALYDMLTKGQRGFRLTCGHYPTSS